MYYLPTDSEDDAPEESIQGQWTGHLYYERKSAVGLMQFVINSSTGGALTGNAATSVYDVDISGNVKEGNEMHIRLVFGDRYIMDLVEDLDIEKGVIKGWVKYMGPFEDEDNKQSPDEEAGGDHGASNDDRGDTKENSSRDEGDEQSSNDEEDDEDNKDGVGEDGVVLEKDTNGKSTSSAQNNDTDDTGEGHSGMASREYHEADVHHDDSQVPDSSGSADPESEDYPYKFILRRTPASLCRFLPGDPRVPPAPDESAKSHAVAQWKFAYMFVRDRMRRKSSSWQLARDKFAERRRFLDLAIRERCSMYNYCPRSPLSEEEEQELHRLRCTICPMDSRYYYSLVDDQIARRKYL
ncbi:hypothetical protein F5146DRAFT_1202455 [Armillaria mellea]|nr:hypothetical protein F5146DRAFT_1202455 [Armillaria mellea]